MAAKSIMEALSQSKGQHQPQGPGPGHGSAKPPFKGKPAADGKQLEGGHIKGPGTGTSDSITDTVQDGSFIMPADSTQALGPDALEAVQGGAQAAADGGMPQDSDLVALSNGEFEFTKEQVYGIGLAVLEQALQKTHTPTGAPPVTDEGLMAFADGGLKKREDEDRPVAGASGVVRNGNTYSDSAPPRTGSNQINTGRITPAGATPEVARPAPNPAHTNTGPVTPMDTTPRSIAGAAGVTRAGNSYSDMPAAPKVPTPPKAGGAVPSWDRGQSFPSTHQGGVAPNVNSGAANQIPAATQQQIDNGATAGQPAPNWLTTPNAALANPDRTYLPTQDSLAARARQADQSWQDGVRGRLAAQSQAAPAPPPAIAASRAPAAPNVSSGLADQIPGASQPQINAAAGIQQRQQAAQQASGTPSPTMMYAQDKLGAIRDGYQSGNYAGAAGNAIAAGLVAPVMGVMEAGQRFGQDVAAVATNPNAPHARFIGGLLGTDNPDGTPVAGTPSAPATTPYESADLAQRLGGLDREHAAQEQIRRTATQSAGGGATSLSQAARQQQEATNQVRREGNSYSADGPVSGNIQVNGQTPRGGFATAAAGAGSFINGANSVLNPNNSVEARAANAQQQGQYRQEEERARQINAMRTPSGDASYGLLAESRRGDRSERIGQQRVMDAMQNARPAAINGMANAYQEGVRRRSAADGNAAQMDRATMEQEAATQRQAGTNSTSLAEAAMRESGANQRSRAQENIGLRDLALREAEGADMAEMREMEVAQARQMQALRDEYNSAQTDAQRTAISKRMSDLSGNRERQENLSNNFMSVGGGQIVDPQTNQLLTQPTRLVDLRTGQEVGGGPRVTPPATHVAALQKNPTANEIALFNAKYGAGAAEQYLKK